MRVLVIEDEETLRQQLVTHLKHAGYAVDESGTGKEGLFLGEEYPYDVAVVDIGLPDISGLEVIKKWRENNRNFPILILTARSRWQEKVQGLEGGADDYLVKPFFTEELLARLKALVRRASGLSHTIIQNGPMSLNTNTQSVAINDNPVELTAFEYKTLEYLMMHKDKVISKTELTEHIYDQDFDRDSNVIEVFIGRLRRKLDPNNELKLIETLRGRGYRYNMSHE